MSSPDTAPPPDGLPLLLRAPTLPHVDLGLRATPVRRLDLPGTDLWVKDDGRAAPLYGGNKARKLPFLLADALQRGHRSVSTVGAVGSNHALATAVHARRLGMQAHILHFAQPSTPHVWANLQAVAAQAHGLTLAGPIHRIPLAAARMRLRHPDRAWIPGGGSSPTGCLGFVNAGLELGLQITAGALPCPTRVVVAAGTAGTMAGLILGLALARLPSVHVVGVRVVDPPLCTAAHVRRLLAGTRNLLQRHDVRLPHAQPPWTLDGAWLGAGYGVPTPAAEKALRTARAFGLTTETTYTAKAFAAALASASDGPVLYWHTLNAQPLEPLIGTPPAPIPSPYWPWVLHG
jgi:D-cysteine desulfhydrase